jgi:hypothetical protein
VGRDNCVSFAVPKQACAQFGRDTIPRTVVHLLKDGEKRKGSEEENADQK